MGGCHRKEEVTSTVRGDIEGNAPEWEDEKGSVSQA